MSLMKLAGKKIAILGVGEAGRSAARWLNKWRTSLVCCDRLELNKWPAGFLDWCHREGIKTFPERDLPDSEITSCELAVASPGIPPSEKIVKRFIEKRIYLMGELALAASLWKGPIIGITGTNGKTTCTRLTSHILTNAGISNVVAGNISPPFFDCLDQNTKDCTAILEISSFQLEYFPDHWPDWLESPVFSAAVILNIAPDHLDRHGTMKEYSRCKGRLLDFQKDGTRAILGPGVKHLINRPGAGYLSIDLEEKTTAGAICNPRNDILEIRWPEGQTEPYDLSNWAPKGSHNIENLAASIICARILGAGQKYIQSAIETFRPPMHRLQPVREFKGITFINDSKATNAAALIAALKSIKGNVTLIAGGSGKDEDFTCLTNFLISNNGSGNRSVITGAILIGEEAPRLERVFKPLVKNCITLSGKDGTETMKKAVEAAESMSRPGSCVLLSPGCASFDMFSSYKERGLVFEKAVRRLQ